MRAPGRSRSLGHRVEWWVVTAWGSLVTVVLGGLAAAAGASL